MRIGFTGTRSGLTEAQAASLRRYLQDHLAVGSHDEAHHGDCLGADVDFCTICERLGLWTVAHPSDHPLRAYTQSRTILPVKKPMDRNRDIVMISDVLVAGPDGAERRRSGTWGTVRFSRKIGRPRTIIWTDGRIEVEP